MGVPLTLNIQTGRKLVDKSKDEILTELGNVLGADRIRAVQVCYDTIRVTFVRSDVYLKAKENTGLYLFGLWCNILGGGPPVTVVNVFDYPYEEDDQIVEDVMDAFGIVKRIKHQTYVSNPKIYTGTRLVSLVLRPGRTLPRFVTINGYICRIWYRGQPLICNLCAVQGHKSANCPNKDKCRRCGESGHFARACPNPWGDRPPVGGNAPVGSSADPPPEPTVVSSAGPSVGPPVSPGGGSSSVDSLAGLSFGPSVCSSAEGATSNVVVVSAESEPEIGVFSSQSQASPVISDPEIGVFSSQSDHMELSPSPASASGSQSILRNVDKSNVVGELNVVNNDNDNDNVVVPDNNSVLNNVNEVDDPNSPNSNVEDGSMEFDASGPSKKRPLADEDDVGGKEDEVGGFLSRIPRFNPRKLIAKAPKPSKVAKTGKHSKLPVVLSSRPGEK